MRGWTAFATVPLTVKFAPAIKSVSGELLPIIG